MYSPRSAAVGTKPPWAYTFGGMAPLGEDLRPSHVCLVNVYFIHSIKI